MEHYALKNWYHYVHFSFESLFAVITVIMLVTWFIVVVYRLFLNRERYKQLSKTQPGNQDSYRKNIFNLRTFIVRDTYLAIITVVEMCALIISMNTFFYIYNEIIDSRKVSRQVSDYFRCHVQSIIGFSYIHPSLLLFFIPLSVMCTTLLMLISHLNSYLAARYLGNSLPKQYKYKYVYRCAIQCVVQLILIFPKLQLLFFPTFEVFFFYNWLDVVLSSRKVISAIKSRINEIRYFEWNSAHMDQLRNYSTNLIHYKITMCSALCALFTLIVLSTTTIIIYYLELILLGNCYFQKVFGVNINITISHTPEKDESIALVVNAWLALIISIAFAIFFTLPSIVIFSMFLLNSLYSCLTGKVNMRRYNNAIFEPLISVE